MEKAWKILITYSAIILILLSGVQLGSKAVTTFTENRPVIRKHCIVIDPGHGGEDGGAISCSGLAESIYNLEIAQRLSTILNLLGYETKMLRTTDTSIYTKGETLAQKKVSDLKERVRLINEGENTILLSIHQNHFPDKRYSGAQMFYAGTAGSEQLAKQLQSVIVSSLNPGNNRQAKRSQGIYLMEHILCPGVLIECGFLSNTEEEAKLRDPEYQKKLCIVIATATGQFLSNT